MLTTKPFSTISYNSKDYLIKVLNQLFEERYINFYSFVYHYAEEDEHKDHIHLFMIPNKRVDTDSLRGEFLEFELNEDGSRKLDKDGNEKGGLLPLPFTSSKFSEWYLYSSHNEKYLTSKCITRKYQYQDSDFINSDNMYFTELLHSIDWNKLHGQDRFVSMIKSGMTFKEIIDSGIVPVQLFHQYRAMYKILGGKDKEHRVPIYNADGEIYAYDLCDEEGFVLRREYLWGSRKDGFGTHSLTKLASGGASEGGFIPPESTEQG